MKIQLSKSYMDIKSSLTRVEVLRHAEKRSAESKAMGSRQKRRSLRPPLLPDLGVMEPFRSAVTTAKSRSSIVENCDNERATVESDPGPFLESEDFAFGFDEAQTSDETEPMDIETTTTSAEIRQDSRLLDLPTELRIRVFDCLLERSLPVCLLISAHTYLWGQGLPKDIASCARVCKHLNAEVQDIIWERLNFKIRADNGHGLPSSTSLGATDTCDLLRRMRRLEVCFPISAIRGYDGDPDPAVMKRLKTCAQVLEKCSAAREITFNCDTNAYVGEHDDKGVDLVTRAFRDVLVLKRSQGVKVKVINANLRTSSTVCAQLLREAGLMV